MSKRQYPVSPQDEAYPDSNGGGLTKLEHAALTILAAFISSGRKLTVINGREVTLEKAAIIHAKRLMDELNEGYSPEA